VTPSLNVGQIATNNTFSIPNLGNVTHFTVSVHVNHLVAGCSSDGILAVNVNNYQVLGQDQLCFGQDAMFHVNPIPTNLPYQIVWRIAGTAYTQTVSNNENVVIPFSAFGSSGDFIVRAEILFSGGMTVNCDELMANVKVHEAVPPVASLLGSRLICVGQPYEYSVNPSGLGVVTWNISGGTPTPQTGDMALITWIAAPYSIQLIRAIDGCFSAPLVVSDFDDAPTPTLDFTGNWSVCASSSAHYLANAPGTWTVTPANLGSIVSGQGTNQVTILWNSTSSLPAMADVQLTSIICGSLQTVTHLVTVNPGFPLKLFVKI
jgi:hypothetical protein